MQDVQGGDTVQAFIARRRWLAEQGRRLDASAYGSGGLQARDLVMTGPWKRLRLDQATSRMFYEARFSRTYVAATPTGVPYLTGSDMLLADLNGVSHISRRKTENLADLIVHTGWTLMTRSGTIGRTAYVRPEMHGMVASDDVIRLVPNADAVAPGYLFAFLTSATAQAMIRQRVYGSVVQHIEPHHIADLPVPLPDSTVQERIHGLVVRAAEARTEAGCLLDEVAAHFNALVPPMPSVHEHARAEGIVRRSTLNYRLDAFHHVGWAAESGGLAGTPLGELGHVSRPGIVKRIYVERGVPFVSGIDVYQARVTFRERIRRLDAELANALVERGQILVQRSGQRYGLLGRPALVTQWMDGWATSEDLLNITLHSKEDIASVFAFLRSDVGRRAVLRSSYGTSIPHLNPDGLAAVKVATCPASLASKAQSALDLREQADADEEQAIREVEAWLNC